ncbi:DUF1810 domain-containing protein [Polaromonas sp.]|uniref:DUF1810 domain-containing protein n=1 Tax=Polaromonas sp. TaxID=1869339 RepID=UPI00352AB5E2
MTYLDRYVQAQANTFKAVIAELHAGRKTTHWIWFVFPQLAGLGRSEMARYDGLKSADQAWAYWQHPLLGPRLKNCCDIVLAHKGCTAQEIFGSLDALKLRSSMTLFETACRGEPVFKQVLQMFFGGERDALTTALLETPA